MAKSQKTTKSKKWVQVKKVKASKTKNLGQLGTLFISKARTTFTKLRQAFVEAPILNHFHLKRHIYIEINAFSYTISGILS